MPGGAIKNDSYEEALAQKTKAAAELLSPFGPPVPMVYPSPPTGFRMRAEFRIWHDYPDVNYVMFEPGRRDRPYPVDSFPIAAPTIQRLMPDLLACLQDNDTLKAKLFQVEFLSTTTDELIATLVYHRKLDEQWLQAATDMRRHLLESYDQLSIIGRSRGQKITLGREFARECFTIDGVSYSFRHYEQTFTQPNAAVNANMIEWASAQANGGDLLELYGGCGNFTIPLAKRFGQVIMTEVAKHSARAASENLIDNRIDNVTVVRLSAAEVGEALRAEREFRRLAALPKPLTEYDLRTVLVDPPRAGLDTATVAMVGEFERILYISCNPNSLARDLEILHRSHDINAFAIFDQFPYTDHLECGVSLQRRNVKS